MAGGSKGRDAFDFPMHSDTSETDSSGTSETGSSDGPADGPVRTPCWHTAFNVTMAGLTVVAVVGVILMVVAMYYA